MKRPQSFKRDIFFFYIDLLPYDITKGNTAARSSYTFEQLYCSSYDNIYDITLPRINVLFYQLLIIRIL